MGKSSRNDCSWPDPKKTFLSQLEELDLSDVRLIALSAISFEDGRLFPITEIARFCREKGIYLCVDAIQAVGVIPVDVRNWGCDFLACGGQKWLFGPIGSGFLYMRKEILSQLHVPFVGWASQKATGDFTAPLEFADSARRFEPGLLALGPIAGLGKSLEELEKFGWERIFSKIQKRRAQLESSFPGRVHKRGGEGLGGGIVSLKLTHEEQVNLPVAALHRVGHTRFSVHAVTNDCEINFLKKNIFPYHNVLITGASQGLGAAMAQLLASKGCKLVLMGRSEKRLRQLAQQIPEARCRIIAASLDHDIDLPDEPFDLIINNAAMASFHPFEEENEEEARIVFETNFFAPRQALANLPFKRRGIFKCRHRIEPLRPSLWSELPCFQSCSLGLE
jgi:hypothetical protein